MVQHKPSLKQRGFSLIELMIVMAVVNLVLLLLSETKVLLFAWSWLVILGTAGTMLIAVALSPLLDRADSPAAR